jgi:hypothetical protein
MLELPLLFLNTSFVLTTQKFGWSQLILFVSKNLIINKNHIQKICYRHDDRCQHEMVTNIRVGVILLSVLPRMEDMENAIT